MEIIFNPPTIAPNHAIALGNFDGVHLGHKVIIAKMREIAREQGLMPAVITFEPHPTGIFRPNSPPVRINDLSSKASLLAAAGVQKCYIFRFTHKFSEIKAIDFLDKYLHGSHVVTGFNFSFGHNREGGPEMLTEALGGNYTQIPPVEEDGAVFSSSMVRMALKSGDVRMANRLLGYNYFVNGMVIEGAGKGSRIGFPTANIKLKSTLLRPRYGVYAVDTKYGRGVANFGVRPTVDGRNELLEVHIFDFHRKIYGEKLKVEFLDFIREERTFKSLEELKVQIKKDCIKAMGV